MNFYADSNYIHAKICALHGLLLAGRDYYDIAKNGNFQSLVPGLDTGNIKNDYTLIKERIFDSQVSMVISLAEASASSRRIFILFLRYFETLNLKLLCAKAFGREPSPFLWYNIGDLAVLDRGMLTDNTDMAAILKYTGNTWMRNILTTDSAGSFEEVEFLIDRAALRIAAEFPYSMKFSRRNDSMKIVSGLAAYFRLSWSRRLEYIYAWDPERIMDYIESNMVLPEYGRAMRVCIDEWEKRLMKQLGDDSGGIMPGGDSGLITAEKIMERTLLRDFSRMFHENFHSINTLACYLVLLYCQIRNLFSIVDGLRFGLAPDMIMENVICEG